SAERKMLLLIGDVSHGRTLRATLVSSVHSTKVAREQQRDQEAAGSDDGHFAESMEIETSDLEQQQISNRRVHSAPHDVRSRCRLAAARWRREWTRKRPSLHAADEVRNRVYQKHAGEEPRRIDVPHASLSHHSKTNGARSQRAVDAARYGSFDRIASSRVFRNKSADDERACRRSSELAAFDTSPHICSR